MTETKRMTLQHSIWLCPTAAFARRTRSEIRRLALLTGTAPFQPHVTLLGDVSGEPVETEAVCTRVLAGAGPFVVTVRGVVMTDNFFMSLFLDLETPATLERARYEIARALGIAQNPPFRPHLSLGYGFDGTEAPAGTVDGVREAYMGCVFELQTCVVAASSSMIPIEDWKELSRICLLR